MQPGSGIGPDAVGSASRDVEHLGRFGLSQPGEIAELDQLARGPIDLLELVERGVEGQQILARLWRFDLQLVEVTRLEVHTHQVASVPQPPLAPGILDEDASHRFRRRREEVASLVPLTRLTVARHQSNERFVNQRRRLQSLAGPFVRQL